MLVGVLSDIVAKRIEPTSAVSAVASPSSCAAAARNVIASADASTQTAVDHESSAIPTSLPSAEAGVARRTDQPIIMEYWHPGETWVPSVQDASTITSEASSAEAGVSPTPTIEVPIVVSDEASREPAAAWLDDAERWRVASTNATNRITIIAVGGYPGAGVRTQVTLSAALMRARDFEAFEIYTDSYHNPVPTNRCAVCAELYEKLGRDTHTSCNLCPYSFDVASLVGCIDEIINSQQYDKRIVIFVAGRNVLGCPAILDKATVLIRIGLPDHIGLCALRRLSADGLGPPALSEDHANVAVSSLLASLAEDTTLAFNRLYAHAYRYERVVGRRHTIQYCDVENKTIREVATEFDHIVLDMLSAPLTNAFDAGSCLGSDIYDLYQ